MQEISNLDVLFKTQTIKYPNNYTAYVDYDDPTKNNPDYYVGVLKIFLVEVQH